MNKREQYISLALHPDPEQRLNGWHNHRTGLYEAGPVARANPPSDLFPQTPEMFALYEQYQDQGMSLIIAAIMVMMDDEERSESANRYQMYEDEYVRLYGPQFAPPWEKVPEEIESIYVDGDDVLVVRCHQCGGRSQQITIGVNPTRYLCLNPECHYVMTNHGAAWYIKPSDESPVYRQGE